jgi:L-ascorbate metabolism protein UlaG (beta-lactamase superfamily)
MSMDPQLAFLGHATLLIEMDGVRILTDPVLRDRVGPILRVVAPVERRHLESIDAILVSHAHLDHLDVASLRGFGPETRIIVPVGAARILAAPGLTVEELGRGVSARIGPLTVTATFADHSGYRPPFGPRAEAIGFLIEGRQRIYFAGDTDVFPGMTDLAPGLDLALLPVWGWGPRLGPGHMNPERAAEALTLLRPRIAMPIHWGTLWAQGLGPIMRHRLVVPPRTFRELAGELAPSVDVRIVEPNGEPLSIP